jgi:hypothetical protein
MTDNRGGYRKPEKPAPVSGPGKYAKRTDGGPVQKLRDLTGGKYGEGQAFRDAEQAAPMAAQGPPSAPAPAGGASRPVDVVPFDAPTQHPDEPVTSGNPMGAGVGPEALGLQDPLMQIDREDATRMLAYLPALEFMANQPGASSAMRAYVRYIRSLAT